MNLLTPLPYQEAAVLAFEEGLAQGHLRQVAFMPTGCGKTILALLLARKRGRTLYLAHRKELLDQPLEKLPLVWPGAKAGIVKADRNEWWATDVVFASVQTACKPSRLDQLAQGKFELIVVDETHHASADTYRRVLDRFPQTPVLGLTATPTRADGKNIGCAGFTAFCYWMTIDEAIRWDYLSPYVVQAVPIASFDRSKIPVKNGDYDHEALVEALKRAHAVEESVKAYLAHATDRKTIIFTVTVEQARLTAEALQKAGVAAGWVCGETDDRERAATLQELRAGRLRAVANCGILTEGFDDPAADCALIARPTASKGLHIQMIGRILRKYPGKKDALILDLVGNYAAHGTALRPRLVTAKQRAVEAGGMPILRAFQPTSEEPESQEGSIVDRFLAAASSVHAATFQSRKVAWIECAPNLFAIPLGQPGPGWIVLLERDGRWIAEKGAEVLFEHPDVSLVQGFAEEHARRLGALGLSVKDALWRSRPASEEQEGKLARLRAVWSHGVTQGEASDLITAALVRSRYRAELKRRAFS